MAKSEDIVELYFQDFSHLLLETQKSIVPKKQQIFELGVASALSVCIKELSKEAHSCSNAHWPEIDEKWHELRKKFEKLGRRRDLLLPTSESILIQTLYWMAEQGEEEDLDLIKKLKRKLPYSSKEIKRLLKIAEQQISARVKRPVDVLSDEELIELTELKLTQEQQVKLSELLEQNREGTLDSEGQRQLDELMNIYERGLLRKSEALREAVKRGIKEPLQQ